ncbi:MAG: hypothetical protein ACWGPN_17585 [Gammaproteobacteria bacterium]
MSLLFWKNNKLIDGFAQTVADELFSYVSADLARQQVFGAKDMPKKQARKAEQKFQDTVLQIRRFSESHSLGVYGKARLQQKFDERLQELGYPKDVVKRISELILARNV